MSVNELLEEALKLPAATRASFVEKVVESLAADIDPDLEKAHLKEIARRKAQAALDLSVIISGPKVLKRARALLRR